MADETATTVWACRSRFCLQRGPFWMRTLKDARAEARKHRARRFLGIWSHDAVVGPRGGESFMDFLREMGLSRG